MGGPTQVSGRWTGQDPVLLVELEASSLGTQAPVTCSLATKVLSCQKVVIILTLQAASEEASRTFCTKNCNTDLSVVAIVPLRDEKNPRVREH